MNNPPKPPRQSRVLTAAATGDKPKFEVTDFKPIRRDTLRGFATVQFSSGLRLLECPVHVHHSGRAWVALPGRPVIEEGCHKRDPSTGKLAYVPMAQWCDRTTSDRFSELVIALLRERWPSALEGDAV